LFLNIITSLLSHDIIMRNDVVTYLLRKIYHITWYSV